MGRGLFMAVLGGFAGALGWCAVAYCTGYALGFFAIALGAVVGAAMLLGVNRQGSVGTGMVAAVAAIVSIVGAKAIVGQALASRQVERSGNVSEQVAIDHYAGEVYNAFAATGRYMGAPDGSGWPAEVMREARRLWSETPGSERAEYMQAVSHDLLREAQANQFGTGWTMFLRSFRWLDLLYIGVAVAGAYRTGCHNSESAREAAQQRPANAEGLVGGPLSRGAPAGGGAGTARAPSGDRKAGKGKVQLDEDDRRGAGIFARLAEIEEREQKDAPDQKKAA